MDEAWTLIDSGMNAPSYNSFGTLLIEGRFSAWVVS